MRCLFRNIMCCHVPTNLDSTNLDSSRDRIKTPIIIICILCASVPFLYADTTWVAGDVYGVWDTTGSPFMVTDTITVPLDSTLEIRPGVEIWFLDQEIQRTRINVH